MISSLNKIRNKTKGNYNNKYKANLNFSLKYNECKPKIIIIGMLVIFIINAIKEVIMFKFIISSDLSSEILYVQLFSNTIMLKIRHNNSKIINVNKNINVRFLVFFIIYICEIPVINFLPLLIKKLKYIKCILI